MRGLFAARTLTIRALAGIAAATLVAACVTEAGGTTPDPRASDLVTPQTTTAAASDECGSMSLDATFAPFTIADLVSRGNVLVVGTVKAIEPSIYNTSDGKRPRGFGTMQGTVDNPNADIITPVVILVSKDVNSSLKPGAVRAYIRGGTVGCFQERVDFAPSLQAKVLYAFVLQDGTDADGTHSKDFREILYAYVVDANNMVQTEQGKISLDNLIQQVQSVTPAPTR
jgi:hypothetical protein